MPDNPLRGLSLVTAGLLASALVSASPMLPHRGSVDAAVAHAEAVERYQVLADRRARDHDPIQDIGPEQLLVLLEVAERTDYGLGRLLATGEHESARTWNDFVRPRLDGDRLGVAAGVWQFQPKTFERVIHLYGEELLALTAADPAAGRRRLDLGFGPFCDAHVRRIIGDTIDGLRDPDDPELRLLRHNFTVLALAKYLLSKDGGARDPVEDYLFHFLGSGQGRRVLELARGEARDTRTVKPPPPEEPDPAAAAALAARPGVQPGAGRRLTSQQALRMVPEFYRPRPGATPAPAPARPATAVRLPPGVLAAPAIARQPSPAIPAWPAPYGYEHDSPVVTGNLRMFYRDGIERTDPYTWAEFLAHLARRVRADRQPKLVRAKYGVGFALPGGDMPEWAYDPDKPGAALMLRLDGGGRIEVPKARLTAPLGVRELHDYQRRLAALIRFGEAEPTATLSDAAATALYRLGLLSGDAAAATPDGATFDDLLSALGTDMGAGRGIVLRTDNPRVRAALHAFRDLVGKAPPDDPAHADLLMPAERVALEIYAGRIERFILERASVRE